MLVPKLSWLVLVVQCLTSLAYDISTVKKPQGQLGVTLDYSLAVSFPRDVAAKQTNVKRNWVWSSHLTFKNPVSEITAGQMWKLAADAYAESKCPLCRGGQTEY